jgi:hypothetical protein
VKYLSDCQAAVVGKGSSTYPFAYCSGDAECASGRCFSGATTCSSTCYPGLAAGAACALDRDCAPGLYCYSGSLWGDDTCQPYSNRPDDGQPCTIATGCKPGLYCDGSNNSAIIGSCKPQVSAGSCPSASAAMAPGFGCFSGTAQPLLGPGETCSTLPDYCGPGLYCGPGDRCTQQPAAGEPCAYYNGAYQDCLGGYCGLSTFMCIRSFPSTCYSDWDCESIGFCYSGCRSFCF